MKTKDVPNLKQKVLDMLPITQAEIWKSLGIGSRDGSSLITIMLEENLVKRTRVDRTFLIEKTNGNGRVEKMSISPLLSSKETFAPCCGCGLDCIPSRCTLLTTWLLE